MLQINNNWHQFNSDNSNMIYRSIHSQTFARELQLCPMNVKQPLPDETQEPASPFLLLHHAGPQHYAPASPQYS
jgi:hypothetical protein